MSFHDHLLAQTASERQSLLEIPIIGDALAGRIDRFLDPAEPIEA